MLGHAMMGGLSLSKVPPQMGHCTGVEFVIRSLAGNGLHLRSQFAISKRAGSRLVCVEADAGLAPAWGFLQFLNFLNNGHDDGAVLFLGGFQLLYFLSQVFVAGQQFA